MSFQSYTYFSNQSIKESLHQEVTCATFKRLFQKLQQESKRLSFFSGVMDIIDFMNDQEQSDSYFKDELLRNIFLHIQDNPHPLWNSFLSLLFWPMLDNLFHKKSFWESDNERENFWQNLYQAFLETISNLLGKPLTPKLAWQISIGTFSLLHDIYEKEWEWKKLKTVCDDAAQIQPQITHPEVSTNRYIFQKSLLEQYQACLQRRIISEEEFAVLAATNIYGKKLKDVAAELNINYGSLKKRRQRAQNKVQKVFSKK